MLADFIANKRVRMNAVIGLYPAASVGDDIEVYTDETRTTVKAKMHGLRQQVGEEGRGGTGVLGMGEVRRGGRPWAALGTHQGKHGREHRLFISPLLTSLYLTSPPSVPPVG